MNYYKDLWTNPNTEAGQFFNKVDFNHKDYKDQEQVFRNFLKGLKRLMDSYVEQKPIETVLEVGVGTQRITKIMIEEFPDIQTYDAVDLKIRGGLTPIVKTYNLDITSNEFDKQLGHKRYDMVVLSEILMHILPKDIDNVISKCSKLLNDNGCIINIDWANSSEPSEWCFIHPYDELYRNNGLQPIFITDINKQKLFCYGK